MATTFKLPNSPLGNFVKANYAPRLRKQVFTKLQKSGFTPPSGGGGRSGGGSTARDRLLPPELIGVAGVRGPFFGITPRLNPNDYVFHTNDRGRIFAEPITETTGLTGQQRRDLADYDAETQRTVPSIQGAYGQLGQALTAESEATKNRLASLGSLIQSSPTVAGAPQGVQGFDDQMAAAQRREATANAAVTVGQMSALPSIAATEGTKAVTGYQSERQGGRREVLSAFRQANADAAAAELERKQADQELAAQLRGQDLQLLGTQISQQGGLERALVSAQTQRQNTLDRLETQLLIAELNGDVSAANNIRSNIARIQAANIGAQGGANAARAKSAEQRRKDQQKFIGKVRTLLNGEYINNPAYDPSLPEGPNNQPRIPKEGSEMMSPGEVLAEGLANGYAALPILYAIRRVIGPTWGRPAEPVRRAAAAESLFNQLLDSGRFNRKQAAKIVRAFTGYKLDTQRDTSGRLRG